MQARKSPFKVDKIEDNPNAYGIRRVEISNCVEALYDDRNILITGPRGIGKSSLAKQMQILYEKNFTLLKRCNIGANFPPYLCTFYACDEHSDLLSLTLDLLFRIEQECGMLRTFKTGAEKKFRAEIDLKVIKTSLESEIISNKPASIVTQFVQGLKKIYNSLQRYTNFEGISILIDEIDKLPTDINFGHFLKLIHEYSAHDGLSRINYILAGQRGTYTRILREDPSIERLVRHVPISKIDLEQSNYILDYASSTCEEPFTIEEDAREIILKLSAGYPYVIHLLGDAGFHQMEKPGYMSSDDALTGLRDILQVQKHEKYLYNISSLSPDERIVIATLANYTSEELPMRIPIDWVKENLVAKLDTKSDLGLLLIELAKNGHIIVNSKEKVCQFNDELFRVYVSLRYLEGSDRTPEKEEKIDEVYFKKSQVEDVLQYIDDADLNKAWEFDEFDDLMKF